MYNIKNPPTLNMNNIQNPTKPNMEAIQNLLNSSTEIIQNSPTLACYIGNHSKATPTLNNKKKNKHYS